MGTVTKDFRSFRIDELPIGVRFGSLVVSGLDHNSNGYVQQGIEDAEVICDIGGEKRIYGIDKSSKKRIWFSIKKDGPFLLVAILHKKKQKTFCHEECGSSTIPPEKNHKLSL